VFSGYFSKPRIFFFFYFGISYITPLVLVQRNAAQIPISKFPRLLISRLTLHNQIKAVPNLWRVGKLAMILVIGVVAH
jgi:hypothetical protein